MYAKEKTCICNARYNTTIKLALNTLPNTARK